MLKSFWRQVQPAFRLALPVLKHTRLLAVVAIAIVGLGVVLVKGGIVGSRDKQDVSTSDAKLPPGSFQVSPSQLKSLTIQFVEQARFRSELLTEGRIAVDEDHATPIFSPYAGRVVKLFVKPGDVVTVGQPLFTVEATDMVQAQNDFIGAATALNKARSALNLAEINDKRQALLYEGKAVPLKEVQNARATREGAENDVRSAEVALEAVRGRLRILGKSDQEINTFQDQGTIDPATVIYAPIAGTIVQRKVGPGQYVGSGSSDPVFIIGDLSTVWLMAYVRESEAAHVELGQTLSFKVLTYPQRDFTATINYVAAAFDPNTRRLPVRAVVDNADKALRPEMFASVSIVNRDDGVSPAVPREAIIYEGSEARVWVALAGNALELRKIKTGLVNGNLVQVLDGLKPGDRVVTRGGLFIDRAAAGGDS